MLEPLLSHVVSTHLFGAPPPLPKPTPVCPPPAAQATGAAVTAVADEEDDDADADADADADQGDEDDEDDDDDDDDDDYGSEDFGDGIDYDATAAAVRAAVVRAVPDDFDFDEFEALERKLTEEDAVPTDDDDDDDDDPLMCLLKQRIRECKLRVGTA